MATIGTRLHTLVYGQYVGKDEFGNEYYHERKAPKHRRRRRWVMYKGAAEPSKVPPHWHGWLHYTMDAPPVQGQSPLKYDWQKPHLPNLTGTSARYLPAGHILKGGKRAKTAADYIPWQPK